MATTSNIVSTLGAGSGIDIKALAESLVEAERAPRKARIDQKITQTEAKISGYGAVKYALSTLKGAFEKINDASEFASIKASNSQPSAFSAVTSSTSGTGSFSIEVLRLATEQRTASESFAARDSSLNGGQPFALNLAIGNGAAQTIQVTTATPAGVVSAINGANLGVSAQLLNTGSGHQIVLSGATGSQQNFSISTSSAVPSTAQIQSQTASAFEVTAAAGTSSVTASYTDGYGQAQSLLLEAGNDGLWRPAAGATLPPVGTSVSLATTRPAISFSTTLQSAQDAHIKVNGLSITRSNNAISDVIDGVTLNLQSLSNGVARLDLARETSGIKDNIKALVAAYNDFSSNLDVLGDRKSEVETYGGALAGDNLLNSVRSQVRGMLIGNSSTGAGNILAARDVGLSIDREGVLQLDESKLDKALQGHFGDVVTMFTADANNQSVYSTVNAGLAGDAVRKLDQMLRTTGSLAQQTTNAQKQVDAYKVELQNLQERMDQLLTRYTKQFSIMDSLVTESNSTRSSLKSTFAAMTSSGSD